MWGPQSFCDLCVPALGQFVANSPHKVSGCVAERWIGLLQNLTKSILFNVFRGRHKTVIRPSRNLRTQHENASLSGLPKRNS